MSIGRRDLGSLALTLLFLIAVVGGYLYLSSAQKREEAERQRERTEYSNLQAVLEDSIQRARTQTDDCRLGAEKAIGAFREAAIVRITEEDTPDSHKFQVHYDSPGNYYFSEDPRKVSSVLILRVKDEHAGEYFGGIPAYRTRLQACLIDLDDFGFRRVEITAEPPGTTLGDPSAQGDALSEAHHWTGVMMGRPSGDWVVRSSVKIQPLPSR